MKYESSINFHCRYEEGKMNIIIIIILIIILIILIIIYKIGMPKNTISNFKVSNIKSRGGIKFINEKHIKKQTETIYYFIRQ